MDTDDTEKPNTSANHTLSNMITSHDITSHHITSHHITPHHITSHHTTSHHITPHHITSHHITSYPNPTIIQLFDAGEHDMFRGTNGFWRPCAKHELIVTTTGEEVQPQLELLSLRRSVKAPVLGLRCHKSLHHHYHHPRHHHHHEGNLVCSSRSCS